MTAPDADRMSAWRDELAGVLCEHREDHAYPDTCVCETDVPDFLDNHFATHLADALFPLLTRIDREARREGIEEGVDSTWHLKEIIANAKAEALREAADLYEEIAARDADLGITKRRAHVWLRARADSIAPEVTE